MTITLVDNTPTTEDSTSRAFQKKCFRMNGLTWVFYSNGTNFGYKTSVDGYVAFTTLFAGLAYGFWVSFWYDSANNILYYARQSAASSANVYYRWGTPNSDGTITWIISEGTLSVPIINSGASLPSCTTLYFTKDVNGNLYLSFCYAERTPDYVWHRYLRTYKYVSSWSELTNARTADYGSIAPVGGILPLTGNKLGLVHAGATSATVLKVRTSGDSGATWTADVATGNTVRLQNGSWTSKGDAVCVAADRGTTWYFSFYKFVYGDSSWTTVDIGGNQNYESYYGISIEDSSGKLHVWLITYNQAWMYHYYSVDSGATWTQETWSSTRTIYVRYLTVSPHDYGNLITFAWKEGSTLPYYVYVDTYSTAVVVAVPKMVGDGLTFVVACVRRALRKPCSSRLGLLRNCKC